MLRIILDTRIIYTQQERQEFITYVNGLVGAPHTAYDSLVGGVIKKPRNLKLDDLVWGGIMGNASTGYVVKHKIDGIRKLLVFATSGIWLIFGGEVCLIMRQTHKELIGCVFDGELIPAERRRNPDMAVYEYWFIIFDTVVLDSDLSVQQDLYVERMTQAQSRIIALDEVWSDQTVLAVNVQRISRIYGKALTGSTGGPHLQQREGNPVLCNHVPDVSRAGCPTLPTGWPHL